jgi:ribosomal-protein-alanine N-acetyltransferase
MGSGAWEAARVTVTEYPNETLTIRRCQPSDLEQVAKIERVSFSDPWSFETFSAALALRHMRFLVAEERASVGEGGGSEPQLVGYVVALMTAEEGEVADVAVAPTARRRGVARALLDRVTAQAMETGVRALYLEVRESNHAARALYESLGFAQVGRRRGYYQRPSEDALLLRRDLAPT